MAKVAAGEWRPLVTTYPLADAARAHADLEDRRALGKVLLLPIGAHPEGPMNSFDAVGPHLHTEIEETR